MKIASEKVSLKLKQQNPIVMYNQEGNDKVIINGYHRMCRRIYLSGVINTVQEINEKAKEEREISLAR